MAENRLSGPAVQQRTDRPSHDRGGWLGRAGLAGLVLLLAVAGAPGKAAGQVPVPGAASPPRLAGVGGGAGTCPTAETASQWLAAARHASRAGDPGRAVDLGYRAVVAAYAAMVRPVGTDDAADAVALYNRAVAECLSWGIEARRLDARSRLLVTGPAGRLLAVPVRHQGFLWEARDFDTLVDPTTLRSDTSLHRPHRRRGLGAPQVVLRQRRGDDPSESFFVSRHPFVATALIVPDLDAWFGDVADPQRVPADQVVLVDPYRVGRVELEDGRRWPIAANFDAQTAMMDELLGGNRYRFLSLLRPDRALDSAHLYMVEPYQPGKIPVVLIHGLWSSPTTWSDLQGDLLCDPEVRDRYQVWTFTYPTGMGLVLNAQILRESLTQAMRTFDPEGRDPAMRRSVLVAHSMGGLLAKLQTTYSDNTIWETYSNVPFEQLVVDPEWAALIHDSFYFEPQPAVARVVFIATPHRGSTLANSAVGRLSSVLIREPSEWAGAFRELRRDNPGAMSGWLRRRPPTSIDLLQADHPLLLAMLGLTRGEGVAYHSIIGVGGQRIVWLKEPTDGVVPYHSATIDGVESELLVEARHRTIHSQPETTIEVRRILLDHAAQEGAPRPAVEPAMRRR